MNTDYVFVPGDIVNFHGDLGVVVNFVFGNNIAYVRFTATPDAMDAVVPEALKLATSSEEAMVRLANL